MKQVRKPKIHPQYKMSLVGINFRERWNIVQYATKEEICRYIANFEHIKTKKRNNREANTRNSWWEQKMEVVNESTQNVYLRKLWRKRHSESFETKQLYQVQKNIARWSTKLSPTFGDGLNTAYHFDRSRGVLLRKGDIIVLTRVDEMGNLYFSKINDIAAAHLFVFNRDNAHLGFIMPMSA